MPGLSRPPGPVLIVGAGPAGLATAYHLGRLGVGATILERGEVVGASFAHMRPSLRLVSPRWFSELPGLHFPEGSAEYLPMREYQTYLARHAREQAMDVRTGIVVVSARREGDGYVVEDAAGGTHAASHLVAATGVYTNPYVPPELPLDRLTVPWSHSRDYVDAAPYRGRRVLVVGAALSGLEIALEIMEVGAVDLCGRRPFQVVPDFVLGIDLHYFSYFFEWMPVRWMPWLVPFNEPLSGEPIRQALRSGRVGARPGIRALDGDRITFVDGATERYDAVILATGYRPAVDWLAALVRRKGDVLEGVDRCASREHPGLWFVGYPYIRNFASRYLRGLRRDAALVAGGIRAALDRRGV